MTEDRYSNDERGAAAAERFRANHSRRAEKYGCEEWEIPDVRDCQ